MIVKYEIFDDEYLFVIGNNKEVIIVSVIVGNMLILVIIDSGVSVNVLDIVTFNYLMDNGFVFRKFNVRIYLYDSEMSFFVKGIFSINVLTF